MKEKLSKFNSIYGKWLRVAGFIAVVIAVNAILYHLLVFNGVTRLLMHEFYEKDEKYDCVFFGQSHTTYGVDPEIIERETGLSTINASIGGEYMMDMYYMVKQMYTKYSPKMVVLDLDYGYFINVPYDAITPSSTIVYINYPFSFNKLDYALHTLPSRDFRIGLFPWLNSRDNVDVMDMNFWFKRTEGFKTYAFDSLQQIEPCDTYKGRGYLYRDRSFVRSEQPVGIFWNEPKVDYTTSVEYFKKIVELCRKNGSEVVMMTTPTDYTTLTRNDGSFDEYNQIEGYFGELARDNNLTYYNFNLVRKSVYERSPSDYWDADGHMYGDASVKWSTFLGKFLNKLKNGETIDVKDYIYDDIYDMMNHEGVTNVK